MRDYIEKQIKGKLCSLMQFRTLTLALFCLLLSGCSLWPFKLSDLLHTTKPPAAPSSAEVQDKVAVSPEARQLFSRARVLWQGKETCSNPELALDYLDEALRIEPNYADALQQRGLALSQLGYWDESFDDHTRSILLYPSAEAYGSRGLSLLRQGNHKGARQDFDHAIALDPEAHRAWNFRGALSWQEGDLEAACSDLKKGCSQGDCTPLETAKSQGVCK